MADSEIGGNLDVRLVGASNDVAIESSIINGDVYLDVFSCKKYSIEKVKEVITEFFSPEKITTTYLERQA